MRWCDSISRKCPCSLESDAGRTGEHVDAGFGCGPERVIGLDEEELSTGTTWTLAQRATNPATYTKLSCFLPWIASKYGLQYEGDSQTDPACSKGEGDPTDVNKPNCTTAISQIGGYSSYTFEQRCIFPFYYNNVKHEECILNQELGFVQLVYRCPIYNSPNQTDGINSYTTSALTLGGCLVYDPELETYVPDPEFQDCYFRRSYFGQCKTNCPGGETYYTV